jgi:hypothetical protein
MALKHQEFLVSLKGNVNTNIPFFNNRASIDWENNPKTNQSMSSQSIKPPTPGFTPSYSEKACALRLLSYAYLIA